jgi:hypothetical protein
MRLVPAPGGAGLLYDSLQRRPGSNVVAHQPCNIPDITVLATSRMIDIRELSL